MIIMTTITIDPDCLANVDKLQSLLKLRFDKLDGQTITRGTTVNWAVEQQIKALATPVMMNSSTTTFPTASYTATSCGNPLMPYITYMANSSFNTITTATSGQTITYGDA